MGMIKGTDVTLTVRTLSGYDAFNQPIYTETTTTVSDVLVGQPSSDDIVNNLDLHGKRLAYVLGIPKGDTHEWEDTTVQFFGRTFRTFGSVIEGIEENVPTRWHKKVMVELYE